MAKYNIKSVLGVAKVTECLYLFSAAGVTNVL